MAVPKHKNIRKITVDNIQYYWTIRYDEDYGLLNCTFGLMDQPNFRCSFRCGVDDIHVRYIQNGIAEEDEVNSITPKLIAQAIQLANNNVDWKNTKEIKMDYKSNGFIFK